MAGVGLYVTLGGLAPATGAAAGFVLVLLGMTIARSEPVLWGIAVTAIAYVGSLYGRALGFDPWSLVVALALLGSSELAHWSIDCRVAAIDDVRVHAGRAVAVGVMLLVAVAPAVVVLAAAALGTGGALSAVTATAAVVVSVADLGLMLAPDRKRQP